VLDVAQEQANQIEIPNGNVAGEIRWRCKEKKEGTLTKTNAVRVLDRLAINYQLSEYDVDPDDLSAETVAAKIGLPAE
jgi:hypothetical protein